MPKFVMPQFSVVFYSRVQNYEWNGSSSSSASSSLFLLLFVVCSRFLQKFRRNRKPEEVFPPIKQHQEMGWSAGLVVMGDDSCLRGSEFKSGAVYWMDVTFFHNDLL